MAADALDVDPKAVAEHAEELVRDCLALNPVVVLGSGASAGLGLPTMPELADRILEAVDVKTLKDPDKPRWDIFQKALAADEGLEPALNKANLDEDSPLFHQIVDIVWKAVIEKDAAVFEGCRIGSELPHARLFSYLLGSAARHVSVVTPNYDRLAEYGADQAGIPCRTGFSGSYFRQWSGWTSGSQYERHDRRRLDLYKVHGSLDWFREQADHDPTSLPVSPGGSVPTGMRPVIVPPSRDKYRQSQFDPYRSLMTEADRVLKSADAFFCVGYGFNDVHVQLYLNQALRQRPKPLVMISWGLTENAQAAITQASKDLRYCVMTRADDGSGTVVRTHEHRDGVFIEGLDTWSFDGFAREYL